MMLLLMALNDRSNDATFYNFVVSLFMDGTASNGIRSSGHNIDAAAPADAAKTNPL
ncbi:MAG TPA: hypothetical protein VJ698_10940 [Noviherbaspirillum sp.]|uniref:hypothetical protein n=1 Tax=Noviherbaspirillum sp. TaxID=1926288 RepID=UPI002B49B56B|nr:hypothetical protein [Noviherbaspirillum sp.]HJV85978.1 hypothetical protein [Noviherbaspirillum sp.]